MPGLRERLHFSAAQGEVTDGPRRYLLMRPDVLMSTFARLDPATRTVVLQALAESAAEHGADSIRAYHEQLGGRTDELLLSTAAAAADLGWGRWSLHRSPTGLALAVENSPFAAGYLAGAADPSAQPVCAPIRGLLSAVASVVLGGEVACTETHCRAAGHSRCEFSAERMVPRP